MTYVSTVIADGASDLWTLSDAPGSTTAADSAGSHPGTAVGSPTFGVPGLPGVAVGGLTACRFVTASSQRIDLSGLPSPGNNNSFTVEVWVRIASTPGANGYATSGSQSSGENPEILVFNGSILMLSSAVAVLGSASSTISSDFVNFHHLVWTRTGSSTHHLYQDGVDITPTITPTSINPPTTRSLGYDDTAFPAQNGRYLNGDLAMVAWYSGTALSPGQIANHYALGNTPPSAVPTSLPGHFLGGRA